MYTWGMDNRYMYVVSLGIRGMDTRGMGIMGIGYKWWVDIGFITSFHDTIY
jgi:hypothetical protein